MKKLMFKQFNLYLYIIIVTLIFSILNPFLLEDLSNNIQFKNYYDQVEYDYTARIENKKQDYYFDCRFDFALQMNESGSFSKYITSNSLMLADIEYNGYGYYNEKNIAIGEYKLLQNNEISITKNIADKYEVTVNDVLYGNVNGKGIEYRIANILKDTYDFLDPLPDEYQRYIFIGYDEKIEKEDEYIAFVINDGTPDFKASKYCLINNIVKEMKKTIIIQISIVVFVCILVMYLYFYLIKKDIYNYILLANNGYKKLDIHLLNTKYLLIVFSIILLSTGVIAYLLSYSIKTLLIEIISIFLMVYLVNFIKISRRIK